MEQRPTVDDNYYVPPGPQSPAISAWQRSEHRLPFRQAMVASLPVVAGKLSCGSFSLNVTNSCSFDGCAAGVWRACELLEPAQSSRLRFDLMYEDCRETAHERQAAG